MKTAILFDIDNTLTPPRQSLQSKMVDILKKLVVPFHIAAGSHMELVEEQFFVPLYLGGFRGKFNAFLGNGAIHYFCDYSDRLMIETVSAFNIRTFLGEEHFQKLIEILNETLQLPEFSLPESIEASGDQVVFRGSMINLCPIGRSNKNPDIYYNNRKMFVDFDDKSSYRQQIMEHLKRKLSLYIQEKDLTITLGGETSLDIGIVNQDKTIAVRTLLENGVERLIFIGDALFEGGNDWSIQSFVDNWNSDLKCPLETIQVNNCEDTIETLNALNLVNKSH
jgi:phosphomannomutase